MPVARPTARTAGARVSSVATRGVCAARVLSEAGGASGQGAAWRCPQARACAEITGARSWRDRRLLRTVLSWRGAETSRNSSHVVTLTAGPVQRDCPFSNDTEVSAARGGCPDGPWRSVTYVWLVRLRWAHGDLNCPFAKGRTRNKFSGQGEAPDVSAKSKPSRTAGQTGFPAISHLLGAGNVPSIASLC